MTVMFHLIEPYMTHCHFCIFIPRLTLLQFYQHCCTLLMCSRWWLRHWPELNTDSSDDRIRLEDQNMVKKSDLHCKIGW